MFKILVISLLTILSASASDGAFSKKKEASYEFIVIGTVSEVRVVPLIKSKPATRNEIKKTRWIEATQTASKKLFYRPEFSPLKKESKAISRKATNVSSSGLKADQEEKWRNVSQEEVPSRDR